MVWASRAPLAVSSKSVVTLPLGTDSQAKAEAFCEKISGVHLFGTNELGIDEEDDSVLTEFDGAEKVKRVFLKAVDLNDFVVLSEFFDTEGNEQKSTFYLSVVEEQYAKEITAAIRRNLKNPATFAAWLQERIRFTAQSQSEKRETGFVSPAGKRHSFLLTYIGVSAQGAPQQHENRPLTLERVIDSLI